MRVYKPEYKVPLPKTHKVGKPNTDNGKWKRGLGTGRQSSSGNPIGKKGEGRRVVMWKDAGAKRTGILSQDGDGVLLPCEQYRCEFKDRNQTRRRITLFTNHRESDRAGRMIQWLMDSTGRSLDPELHRWLEQIPAAIRNKLVDYKILSVSQGASGKLLSQPDLEGEPGHLEDWRESLLAKGSQQKQADLVYSRVRRVCERCSFSVWSDIVATEVESYIKSERDRLGGISQQTSNFYIQAVKQFCRWMVTNKRATESPVEHLQKMTVTERRHERRELTLDERTALLSTTAAAEPRYDMSGHERYLLYKLALETGLRPDKELRSLTVSSFNFDDLTVTVKAAYVKTKREDVIPIRPDTAEAMQNFMSGRLPHCKAFNMPNPGRRLRAFKADLKAAGVEYVLDGKYADFYSQRHTFISNVVRSGATIKEAQTLARHSKPEMTIGVYSHVNLHDTRRVVDRLETVAKEVVKTGTDSQVHLRNTCLNSSQHAAQVDNHGQNRGFAGGSAGGTKTQLKGAKTPFMGEKRRGGDSNPRYGHYPYDGLANRYLKPLGHLSRIVKSDF